MNDAEYVDITFRQVDGYGFLPIVKFDEEEKLLGLEFFQQHFLSPTRKGIYHNQRNTELCY